MALDFQNIYQGFQDTADAEMNQSNGPSDFFGWTHHGETARNIDVAGLEYAANHYEAGLQRDWLESMWNKNNEYNTPMAQMARARAAGLNPNLLYGQPIAESQPASGGAEASVGVGNSAIAGSGAARDISSLGALLAQTDLMRAQAEEIRSRIPVNQQKINESIARTNDLLVSVEQRRADVGLKIAATGLTEAQRDNISFEQNMKNQYLTMDVEKLGIYKNKSAAEIRELNAKTKLYLSQKDVSDQKYYEMVNTFAIRKAGLEKQNLLTDAQIEEAYATAKKLGIEGDRLNQIIGLDLPKEDRARDMYDSANSSNLVEHFIGQLMYSIDYASNGILGTLLK